MTDAQVMRQPVRDPPPERDATDYHRTAQNDCAAEHAHLLYLQHATTYVTALTQRPCLAVLRDPASAGFPFWGALPRGAMFDIAPTAGNPRSYHQLSRKQAKLTPPPLMHVSPPATHAQPQLELRLDEYQTNGGSIGYGPNGATFAFTLGPVSDEIVAGLHDVAEKRGTICLYCLREPLFFDPVAIERKGPRKVRIVGRIVGGFSGPPSQLRDLPGPR
jgi:hypothetical protein